MRLSALGVLLPLCLLLPALAALPAQTPEEPEIAILTIRYDKVHNRTTKELLPIARHASGQFQEIPVEGIKGQKDCPDVSFRGWREPGTQYNVYFGGNRIGQARARRHTLGAYDCSALCVVSVETKVGLAHGGRKDSRLGFDHTGRFDETMAQFVAMSSSAAETGFQTLPAGAVSKGVRRSISRFAISRLREKSGKLDASAKVTIKRLQVFLSSRDGERHAFVQAVQEGPNDLIKVIAAVVGIRRNGPPEPLFDLVSSGDTDTGAASYEFLDALDIDGDGRSELVTIYHNYEFHEFHILRFDGKRYEVAHKGPSYGC